MLHSFFFFYSQLIGIGCIKWSKSKQSTPKVPTNHKQSNFSGILPPGAILSNFSNFLNGSDFTNMF